MRKIVRQTTFGVPEIEGEDIWRCTTCASCPQQCPRGVATRDVTVSLRRIASGAGISPAPIHTVNVSLGTEGNPMREAREKRADWAKDLSVKTFTEGTEVLYFPCCYPSYDSRTRKMAAATANILNKAGVDFGILGAKENCCGESIRKTGDEELFKHLAAEVIEEVI
jgi:Fe-S oxidoreductase